MEQHQTGGGRLRGEIYDVLISEGGTPMTHKTLTAVRDSQIEIGLSFHGLCSGSTTNPEEEKCDLGHCGPTHKDSPLHSHEEHIDLRSVGPYLFRGDIPITWGVEFYSFRSRD